MIIETSPTTHADVSMPVINADTPWKFALDLYFTDFMACCLPEIFVAIAWDKGYEFLDKELKKITRHTEVGCRIADKLIRLHQKTQENSLCLCHIEFQNYDPDISMRMLVYRYRIRDRYHQPILSIAVLIDDSPTWRPNGYRETCFNSHLEIQFLVVKLIDYRSRREELAAMDNRLAIVLLAHLAALETRDDPMTRLITKQVLTQQLYQKNWLPQDIFNLYTIMDWLLPLPENLMLEYHRYVQLIEEGDKMPYICTAQQVGRLEGRQEGRREGLQEGLKRGQQKGEARVLIRLLEQRFKNIPAIYLARIKQANSSTLLRWAECVFDAASLNDIFT